MADADPTAGRYRRVQAAMARHGVGALCLATPHLAAFASGARRVQVAGSGGTMPWVVVVAGATSAVVFTSDPDGVPPWMPPAAVEPLCWNRERQLARIAELVRDTRGSIACDVFSPALGDVLTGRTLVDAAPILAAAIAPRSAAEIGAITRALAATRTGLRAAAAAAAPGATVAELLAAFAATMSSARAGFPLHEGVARRNGARLVAAEHVVAGDVLGLEFGLVVDGHAGVVGDTVGCACDVSPGRRAWAEALCALAARCRDGARTGELRAAAPGQGGLFAHGLGIGIEPPLVDAAADDDVMLRAGTVLVLAPVVDGFRATRALLVTERSHRWLEPAP